MKLFLKKGGISGNQPLFERLQLQTGSFIQEGNKVINLENTYHSLFGGEDN